MCRFERRVCPKCDKAWHVPVLVAYCSDYPLDKRPDLDTLEDINVSGRDCPASNFDHPDFNRDPPEEFSCHRCERDMRAMRKLSASGLMDPVKGDVPKIEAMKSDPDRKVRRQRDECLREALEFGEKLADEAGRELGGAQSG